MLKFDVPDGLGRLERYRLGSIARSEKVKEVNVVLWSDWELAVIEDQTVDNLRLFGCSHLQDLC